MNLIKRKNLFYKNKEDIKKRKHLISPSQLAKPLSIEIFTPFLKSQPFFIKAVEDGKAIEISLLKYLTEDIIEDNIKYILKKIKKNNWTLTNIEYLIYDDIYFGFIDIECEKKNGDKIYIEIKYRSNLIAKKLDKIKYSVYDRILKNNCELWIVNKKTGEIKVFKNLYNEFEKDILVLTQYYNQFNRLKREKKNDKLLLKEKEWI